MSMAPSASSGRAAPDITFYAMHWTAPATADDSHAALEKKLWDAANQPWLGPSTS